jgi:hypothetical protein
MIRLRYVFFFIAVTAVAAFSFGFYAGYFGARNIFLGEELEHWTQDMALKAAALVHPTVSGDILGRDDIRRMSRGLLLSDDGFTLLSGDGSTDGSVLSEDGLAPGEGRSTDGSILSEDGAAIAP